MIKCWKEDQTPICFRKFLIFSLYCPPPPPLRHTLNIAKKIHPVHTKCAILSVQLSDSAAFVLTTRPSYSAPMNLLTIFTNVSITAIFFTGNTASYNNITRTVPHWTNQNVFPSLSPTTQPFVSSHPLFANIFASLFHLPVADRRCSNLSDFLVRAKLRNVTQHNKPRGADTHGEKTVSLVNIYLTDKLHTHSSH